MRQTPRALRSLLPVATLLLLGAAPPTDPAAAGYVRAALEAMGGEARLRAVEGVRVEGIGHTHALEQSERFEGPWIVRYEQWSELRDVRNGRVRRTSLMRDYGSAEFAGGTLIVSGDVAAREVRAPDGQTRHAPAPGSVERMRRRSDLAPERVLLLALDAPGLRAERDTVLAGVPHHVVSFPHDGGTLRLFLNSANGLPSLLESRRAHPDDYFWNVWGDVVLRTHLSNWALEPGGFRYPRQWTTEWEGKPYASVSVSSVRFDAPVPADSFAIPAETRAAYRDALGLLRGPATVGIGEMWSGARKAPPPGELRPGVLVIPGGYYVVVVRQPDGLVVLEAPYSSEYTRKVLAEVERRFPGERVKAVVSTGDSWTYVGGVREYVARGIPVYALDLNRPVLERLVRGPRTLAPDSLQKAPREPELRWVGGKTALGAGPNRLELYPVRGSAGERMMMAYFPEHRVLWGSDLVQPSQDGASFFAPQYQSELADAVRREGLAVDTVLAMHLAPTPWSRVTGWLERVRTDAPAAEAR